MSSFHNAKRGGLTRAVLGRTGRRASRRGAGTSRGRRRLGMEALEVRQLLSVSPTMLPDASFTADVAGPNEAPHADISLIRWSHEMHFRNSCERDDPTTPLEVEESAALEAPVSGANDSYLTNEGQPLAVAADSGVLANDFDPDGDPLTAVLVSGPDHGTVKLAADGSFEYTPEADFNGEDSFAYAANDGQTDGKSATVSITVEPVNDAPVAVDDAYSVNEDETLVVEADDVLANDADVDADPLTAVLVSGPDHGTVKLAADGSFEYTPEADFNGEDSFAYAANDGQTDGKSATVSITVEPVNDAPVAVDDAYSVNEDETLVVEADGVLADDGQTDTEPATVNVDAKDLDLTIRLEISGSPFGPETGDTWAGSTFWVDAYVKDLSEIPQGVVGGAIDVLFDPALVNATGSVVYGDDFAAFEQGTPDNTAGQIDETGALATVAGVGVGEYAPFVAWQFARTGSEDGTSANGHAQFAVDPGEGTATVAPANFALVGSGDPVDWNLVGLGTAGVDLHLGDFNGDGLVNHFDLGLWLAQSGPAPQAASVDPTYDLNADGEINPLDLDLLMARMYQPAEADAVDDFLGDPPSFASRTEYHFGENDEIQVVDELFALNGPGADV